ncbi:photosystem II reaction center protein T [Umezakia ovalisporum]|jgi:photosystem II PsbT protein|uniref:Photosystem II reaction center protein T n=2 Tax=Umezakia ovalisporum TaxID=75695 RepID=A0AA43GXX0_9CYAN|nr:photosystem II reaction center protein T [Umezakia ovalisporum]MBI1240510.1 photosystem II reaction center protein T [Nostoc sp. RI_552]MDH6058737.1 photosystem II reaction center protein T [Umezakia ovalisporum FSS-43]MDH6063684.1 photosystem II reaction center protein T [Umezakia ovalisporum FSS-62]MDH6066603.1 photosystem II reaction center protein T [Umezakia ovalisporum APH033B]MDH6072251.1 photosystem II reaction center protein T [Umezakia ovalisporum CobakiLakeA]
MESVAYILIFALALGVLFFSIAFREPPRIEKKEEK